MAKFTEEEQLRAWNAWKDVCWVHGVGKHQDDQPPVGTSNCADRKKTAGNSGQRGFYQEEFAVPVAQSPHGSVCCTCSGKKNRSQPVRRGLNVAPVSSGKVIKVCRIQCCVRVRFKRLPIFSDQPSGLLMDTERYNIA